MANPFAKMDLGDFASMLLFGPRNFFEGQERQFLYSEEQRKQREAESKAAAEEARLKKEQEQLKSLAQTYFMGEKIPPQGLAGTMRDLFHSAPAELQAQVAENFGIKASDVPTQKSGDYTMPLGELNPSIVKGFESDMPWSTLSQFLEMIPQERWVEEKPDPVKIASDAGAQWRIAQTGGGYSLNPPPSDPREAQAQVAQVAAGRFKTVEEQQAFINGYFGILPEIPSTERPGYSHGMRLWNHVVESGFSPEAYAQASADLSAPGMDEQYRMDAMQGFSAAQMFTPPQRSGGGGGGGPRRESVSYEDQVNKLVDYYTGIYEANPDSTVGSAIGRYINFESPLFTGMPGESVPFTYEDPTSGQVITMERPGEPIMWSSTGMREDAIRGGVRMYVEDMLAGSAGAPLTELPQGFSGAAAPRELSQWEQEYYYAMASEQPVTEQMAREYLIGELGEGYGVEDSINAIINKLKADGRLIVEGVTGE